MSRLYPLRFRPIFKRYIWGGRRLASMLGKDLPPGDDYAESWEICDHGPDQSIVENGPLAGRTLSQLVTEHGEALLGPDYRPPRFPLLLKFLDANRTLSVQVHPDDARAAKLDPPDLGKTEAWVILAAEPGAAVYAGLKPGIDRPALAEAIRAGACQECLHRIEPKPGDCIFLPAGTVHALGEGLLVAEIQQSSDTTYRLFDWNRLGPDGKLRELHVQQGLEAIDYARGPVTAQQPQATQRPGVERLVECDKFILDRWRFNDPQLIAGDNRCHILTVLSGSLKIEGDPLSLGDTALLQAALGQVQLVPSKDTVLLDAYLP